MKAQVGRKSEISIMDKITKGINKMIEIEHARNQEDTSEFDSDVSYADTRMRPHQVNVKTSLNQPNNFFSNGPLNQLQKNPTRNPDSL